MLVPVLQAWIWRETRYNLLWEKQGNWIYNFLSSDYKEFAENQPTLQRNISPPSSGFKNKLSNKTAWKRQQAAQTACDNALIASCWFQRTFRRNMSPPSSGLESKVSMKPTWSKYSVFAGRWLSLLPASCWFIQPWRWRRYIRIYIRNVGWLSADYMTLYHRRQNSSRKLEFKTHFL
jgi:hypothetical protein